MACERACFGVVSEELERCSFVEVPDLVRLNDVPAADLALVEEVIAYRHRRARPARGLHPITRTVDLTIPAAFGMRLEIQLVGERARLHRGRRDLFHRGAAGRAGGVSENLASSINLIPLQK